VKSILTARILIGLSLGTGSVREANYVPVQIISELNIPSELAATYPEVFP
jgi:hypothetical protein